MIDLYNGEALEIMDKLISKGIKVDAVICDPPYGTTACKWDKVIPFDEMWIRLNKLIKLNGAIVLFGAEPFSSTLRISNIKDYKYDWIWEKARPSNPLMANKQPLRYNELISVFYSNQSTYNPQKIKGKRNNGNGNKTSIHFNQITQKISRYNENTSDMKYPKSILKFNNYIIKVHPTQKPEALLEYLIKTYTHENELVLDFTMGSGSTMVACKRTNRKGIGIEIDEEYFKIAKERIDKTLNEIVENKKEQEYWEEFIDNHK